MNLEERLRILSLDAQYDLACACGTNDEDRRHRGNNGLWTYPVTLPSGGKGIMLKTLISNRCSNDCRYCPLRNDQDRHHRCSLTPDEVARIFIDYQQRLRLIGLFLTSAVFGTPDRTMQALVDTAELLRKRHHYRGYIHLKIIPGASDAAIERALRYASAVSLNIETPTRDSFRHLSSTKDYLNDIVRPVKLISHLTGRGTPYSRVRQTTQFIVGASSETDRELVAATARLYNKWHLGRVYFSAYQRGLGDPRLPAEHPDASPAEDLIAREHRLYQMDFLLRKYHWREEDIPFDAHGQLRKDIDPKQHWADLHPECFPVRLRTATREELLRVPGLGPVYAHRILHARRDGSLGDLARLGIKGRNLQKIASYTTVQ